MIKQFVKQKIRNIAEEFGINSIWGWQVDGIKVYIISYPKSGRTWLRTLLGKALCDHYQIDKELLLQTHILSRRAKILPTLFSHDMKGSELWHELNPDKSKYRSKKIVFLARQPHDILVSFYFHTKNRDQKFQGSISEFIRDETRGVKKLLNYNKIWYENKDNFEDFLLIRYEDLHQDTVSCLSDLLNFLGATNIPLSVVENAVQFCQFDNMKKMESNQQFEDKMLLPKDSKNEDSYKVRKGKINGYLDYLSKEDIEYIDSNISWFGNCWY